MVRKSKTVIVPEVFTREQKIDLAIKSFEADNTSPNLIADPNQDFLDDVLMGTPIKAGSLKNVKFVHALYDGKAFVIEHTSTPKNMEPVQEFRVQWWHECLPFTQNVSTSLMRRPYRGSVINGTLDSLLFEYGHSGMVCNPQYQRGYVWNTDNQHNFLESMFARLPIGELVFVRNHGYLHAESNESIDYKNLNNENITLSKKNNYSWEIIDGQQRMTTIIKFVTNQIKFRDLLFSELSSCDRHGFEHTRLNWRLIEEEDVDQKELLEMFLMINKGVPQSSEHLAKVQELYDNTSS